MHAPESPRTPLRHRGHSHTRMTLANRLLCAVMLIGSGVVLLSCGPRYDVVDRIRAATVPPADTRPSGSEPVADGWSLRFTWEFDSRLDPGAYIEWVAAQLTHDGFTAQQRKPTSIVLTRLDAGDSYRITIEVSEGPPTHVRVALIASPD